MLSTRIETMYKEIIAKSIQALHKRDFFSHFPEHPSPQVYGETADKEGQEKFQQHLNKHFTELLQPDPKEWIGNEISPYLQSPLDVKYPAFATSTLIDRAQHAFHTWRKVPIEKRAELLVESLERVKTRFFEIAYATMHTTGQGYMMAFQASGPHAADRALEAIASGYDELRRVPSSVEWDKPMGKFNIKLTKTWKSVPKGIGLVIGCSTFPTWNTVPGLYANLITGNATIVKPHPGAILPIAIFIAEIQNVLKENNLDPMTCQLAVDSPTHLITKELAEHPQVQLIDFTGNSAFGSYLEGLKHKTVFTEKTGVNSVIIDSCTDVDQVVQNLAFSVCLYSGQMCTAPQNFYIPASGVKTPSGIISYDDFCQKFITAVNALVENPKAAPFVLGAIQNPATCERMIEAKKLGKIILDSKSITHPVFPKARTATPLVIQANSSQKELFSKELFGPIVLMIQTKDTNESLILAKQTAMEHGAISCAAYTTDDTIKEKIMDEMGMAYTPVSFNLVGNIYVNQNASFSDFHVTGGNPAGNASFTNAEFIVKRFTWVGFREPSN